VSVAAPTGSALEWLLASKEPAVRYLARRDVLGEEAREDAARILDGSKVRALLRGQLRDGSFGVHTYKKWEGAHWRLVSLVELEVPPGEPRAVAAASTVLDWLTGKGHRKGVRVVDGLTRRCASQEGNALAVCCRLGLRDDPRVTLLAESLLEWQWPDGGWNCDDRATRRSSFHESLAPAWGLYEYGTEAARVGALRAAELFLEHRLFRTLGTGQPIHPAMIELHYPPYWHYDVLQALLVMTRLGLVRDERCRDALDLLEEKRLPDGRWQADGSWWRRPGSSGSNTEVVDWGADRAR
jgi:hypothetical protein